METTKFKNIFNNDLSETARVRDCWFVLCTTGSMKICKME